MWVEKEGVRLWNCDWDLFSSGWAALKLGQWEEMGGEVVLR